MLPIAIMMIEDEDDREFMAGLYLQYRSLLYSEICKIVRNPDDTEDLLQSVIERLIDKLALLKSLERESGSS